MIVAAMEVTLRVPWVHSLKEKRMVVKSLLGKTRNKFHVAAAEVAQQDVHQTIVVGFACVTDEARHGDSMLDHILNFIESNTEAEVVSVVRELR